MQLLLFTRIKFHLNPLCQRSFRRLCLRILRFEIGDFVSEGAVSINYLDWEWSLVLPWISRKVLVCQGSLVIVGVSVLSGVFLVRWDLILCHRSLLRAYSSIIFSGVSIKHRLHQTSDILLLLLRHPTIFTSIIFIADFCTRGLLSDIYIDRSHSSVKTYHWLIIFVWFSRWVEWLVHIMIIIPTLLVDPIDIYLIEGKLTWSFHHFFCGFRVHSW